MRSVPRSDFTDPKKSRPRASSALSRRFSSKEWKNSQPKSGRFFRRSPVAAPTMEGRRFERFSVCSSSTGTSTVCTVTNGLVRWRGSSTT